MPDGHLLRFDWFEPRPEPKSVVIPWPVGNGQVVLPARAVEAVARGLDEIHDRGRDAEHA